MRLTEILNKCLPKQLAPLLLRIGLATVFIYAAIAAYIDPNEWVGYLPSLLTDHIDAKAVLPFFSLFELALAAWLMSGVYVRYAALFAAVTLSGIVIFNFSLFAISFRDIGLVFAALALAALSDA